MHIYIYMYILGVLGWAQRKGSSRRNDCASPFVAQRLVSFMERACVRACVNERWNAPRHERTCKRSRRARRTSKRCKNELTKRPKKHENPSKTEPKSIPDRSGRVRGASGAIWDEPGRARSTPGDARKPQKLAKDTQLEPKTIPNRARSVKKGARALSRGLF